MGGFRDVNVSKDLRNQGHLLFRLHKRLSWKQSSVAWRRISFARGCSVGPDMVDTEYSIFARTH